MFSSLPFLYFSQNLYRLGWLLVGTKFGLFDKLSKLLSWRGEVKIMYGLDLTQESSQSKDICQ